MREVMPMRADRRHPGVRRSFVLFAILIIGTSGLLVATGVLFFAQADLTSSARVGDIAQSRALAVSGLKAVAEQLRIQRQAILDGERPELDDELEIYETDTRLGIVRLLPVNAAGDLLAPEAGKLDLNTVTLEELQATELLTAAQARAIIAHRDAGTRAMQSVMELLAAEGVTPADVYGELESISIMDDAQRLDEPTTDRIAARLDPTVALSLQDLLTVFAHEPLLQRDGKLKINLNQPWSDELGRRLDERFGEGTGSLVKAIRDDGAEFTSEQFIVQQMNNASMPTDQWDDVLDALTVESGEYRFGRLDINTAPYNALLALPGISPDQAAQIVEARETLPADQRWTVVWPVLEGIVDEDAFEAMVDRITTRSFTWRVRIAVGEIDADAPDAPLDNPLIYEAVIDLAAPSPRIAYLRDITDLQTTAMIALAVTAEGRDVDPLDDAAASRDEPTDDADPDPIGDAAAVPDLPGLFTGGDAFSEPGAFGDAEFDAGDVDDSPAGNAGSAPPSGTPPGRSRIGRWQYGSS
jgi:DNA uptake protein ComE-like DNA-binding protein